jgi:hypothetical protein
LFKLLYYIKYFFSSLFLYTYVYFVYFFVLLFYILLEVFHLTLFNLFKLTLVSCWLIFIYNLLFNYFSYCGGCIFSFDFIFLTFVWVFSIYLFYIKSYSLVLNLVEERNFFIIFFIFLVEFLSKLIQFFTILIRLIVNLIFGDITKFLLIYNNNFGFFVCLGLIEIFIIFIQSLIFYYMFFYYCEE